MAYVKTLSIDGTKYDIKDANAVQCGTSSSSVAQSVYGKKTFVTGIATKTFELTKQDSQLEGGEITFKSGDTEPNTGKDIKIDRYNGTIRVVGTNSSDEVKTVLQADIQNNILYGPDAAAPTSDNSKRLASTAYINTKFQKVNSLPNSPDANTFYFIPES